MGHVHGLLLVTFYFSAKLFGCVLISKTWIVFWPCDDCFSFSYCCYASGFGVFAQLHFLLKASLYNNILAHAAINKAPLFHSRRGSPAPFHHFLFIDCRPTSRSVKTITSGAGTGDLVYALGKRTE